MPTWILWLSPVIVSPLLAVGWISWASRPRGPEAANETVEQHERFVAALTAPMPVSRSKSGLRSKAKSR